MLDVMIAAIAGFVSFISPCVLPLVPAYIGYMGGRVTNTVSAQVSVSAGGAAQLQSPSLSMRFNTFLHGLAFVLGFTFIFVTLGVLTALLVRTATIEGMIGRIGGLLIIVFGLHFMGVLPRIFAWLRQQTALMGSLIASLIVAVVLAALISWGFTGTVALWDTSAYLAWTGAVAAVLIALMLMGMFLGGAFSDPAGFWNKMLNTIEVALYSDTRRQMNVSANQGLLSSSLMGVVFAAGWTPCIGPTLGLAMTMAANNSDQVGQAAVLMTAYSLGLGIPFLIVALMLDSAQGGLRRLKQHMNTIKLVSGAFLVFIGFLVANGNLQDLSRDFSNQFGEFSVRVEQCTVGMFEGEIAAGQYGTCMSGSEDFYILREQHLGIGVDGQPVDAAEDDSSAQGGLLDNATTSITDIAANAPVVGLGMGNLAPNFSTMTVEGDAVSLSDYRGNVVILNFWYTDCAPCRLEMPEFQTAYEEYADDGLVIIAVNREEDAASIQEFSESLGGLTFPLLLDEAGDIQYEYNIVGYPSTIVLDRDGTIAYQNFGIITETQLEEIIADLL